MNFSDHNLGFVINFSYFYLLLKNHWAYFNQIRYKTSLGDGNSSFFKWMITPLSKGRLLQNSENTLMKFKNILPQKYRRVSLKPGTKHHWVKGILKKNHKQLILTKDLMGIFFFKSMIWYNHMCWFELVSQVSDMADGPLVCYSLRMKNTVALHLN